MRPKDNPVRLLLCTSGGLHGARAMRCLSADPRVRIVGVVLSTRVYGKADGWLQGVWRLYRRSGLTYLLYLWASTGLADFRLRQSVPAQANTLGCPVHATADVNDVASRAFIDQCAPDLLVSAFFNQRMKSVVFERPSMCAVNIHPSLLPALKGVDPVFYAQLRAQRPLGVSVHRVADELDTGQVLAQTSLPVPADTSVLAATAMLFERGAELVLENLPQLLAGDAGAPQVGEGSYDSWPLPGQVRMLGKKGVRLWQLADLPRDQP